MKVIIYLAIILVLTQAATGVEDCKLHPWAKRGVLKRFLRIFKAQGEDANPAEVKVVVDVFNKDSTLTSTTTFSDTVHPKVPAAWRTADVNTCCTKAVYDALYKLPALIVDKAFKNAPSKLEKQIMMIPRMLGKCAGNPNKGRKRSDGEKPKDPREFTAIKLLQHLKDGEGSAITELKKYYEQKAAVVIAWVQFTRGNLMLMCRNPSGAKAAFKALAGTDGQPMVKKADLKIIEDALTKAQEVAKAVKIRIMKFAAMALEKIGGESCKANAKKQKKNLDGEGACPKNAAGVQDCGATGKIKPLDMKMLKPFFSKKTKGQGKMGDKPPKPTGTDAASGTGSRLRFLVESETETDSTEQTVVGDDGADSVEKVVDPADASISFADTTGDDFKASDEAYNSDGVLVDSDGKTMIASEESTEASAVILTLGFSVLAFFAF